MLACSYRKSGWGEFLRRFWFASAMLRIMLLFLSGFSLTPALAQQPPSVVEDFKLVTGDDSRASFMIRFSPVEPQFDKRQKVDSLPVVPGSVFSGHQGEFSEHEESSVGRCGRVALCDVQSGICPEGGRQDRWKLYLRVQ
jgi:hypothetical protein